MVRSCYYALLIDFYGSFTHLWEMFQNEHTLRHFMTEKAEGQFHDRYERALAQVRAEFGRKYPMVIAGKEVRTAGTVAHTSPIDTRLVLGYMPAGTGRHARQAIAAAKARAGAFKDHTPADFKGRKIIVLRNSPRAKYVAERYKDSEVLLVNKETDIYLELAAGRGDVGFGSSVVSSEAFLKKPEGKGYAQVGATVRLEGGAGGVGIAFRKGETALRERVNAALKAIKADGSYKRLADRYFDFDVSGGN